MKTALLILALAFFGNALAAAPSDESLRELLQITGSRKLLDNSMAQLDSMMQASMQQALAGKPVTPQVQQSLDKMRSKIVALLQEEMQWKVIEPMFIDIYRQSLSQDEVDGMLTFYKSKTGQAVIAKMPLVMQLTMQALQQRMRVMLPKMQQIQDETLAELKANRTNGSVEPNTGGRIER